jgi:hypothetical protein
MTDDRSLERAARSWLDEGPTRAPDRALEAALLRIQTTDQERDWHVPWRTRSMTQTNRVLAGVLAVAIILVGGALILRPGGNTGIGGPGPSASAAPSPSVRPSATPAAPPTPSTVPSASPTAVPAVTQSFTSTRDGYKVKYPAGWTVAPATTSWLPGTDPGSPPNPTLDVFTDPGDPSRSFVVVSQPLAKGVTSNMWLTTYEASVPTMPAACWPPPTQMERITISGNQAWVHGGLSPCGFTEAIAFAGGRIYELTAYFPPGATPTDRRLFNAILATVTFDPSAAIN